MIMNGLVHGRPKPKFLEIAIKNLLLLHATGARHLSSHVILVDLNLDKDKCQTYMMKVKSQKKIKQVLYNTYAFF